MSYDKKNIMKRIEDGTKGGGSWHFSTCAEYRLGWYGADADEHINFSRALEIIRKNPEYRVDMSINHGVTDYLIWRV